MYFAEHSLAVEIDELGQTDRNENYEKKKREKKNRRTWLYNFKN